MARFVRRTGLWLTASLALNLFLAGLWIGGFAVDSGESPFEARFRPAPPVFSAQGILFALPEASREQARDLLDARSAEIRAAIEDLRAARRAVTATMAREPLDQAATNAALVELRGRTEFVQSVLHGIVFEIAQDLDPADRERLARAVFQSSLYGIPLAQVLNPRGPRFGAG